MKQALAAEKSILIVDDEAFILKASKLFLQSSGIPNVITLQDSQQVMSVLANQPIAVAVIDLNMPNISGLELLPRIIHQYPHIPVIMMTASDEIETVVKCMRSGAFDYLVKPVESNRLVGSVQKALELNEISSELSSLKQRLLNDHLDQPAAFSAMITSSKKMRALFQYVEVVAATRQPIIITGETGTGKELMARAVHELSGCAGDFVALNVAGLDDNMFSDTLFGHKKGAFTGADQAREGLIGKASGGTLFLDEIGDLSEMSQLKLLRLMQEKEYYPVGSDMVKKSDARIVLATNRDLQQLIAAGKFRNDLYYRLRAHQVQIPPLRDRLEDVPLLLDHFLIAAAATFSKKAPTPPHELATMLSHYLFPGNIRELEAAVYDAVARHGSGVLSMESFREILGDAQGGSSGVKVAVMGDPLTTLFGHFPTISEVEDYLIDKALLMAKGNQGMAANLLGMSRQTLNKRLQIRK